MRFRRSVRTHLALLLLAAFVVYNAVVTLRPVARYLEPASEPDEVTRYVSRFDEIRDTVRHYRVVGYVDDAAYGPGCCACQHRLREPGRCLTSTPPSDYYRDNRGYSHPCGQSCH